MNGSRSGENSNVQDNSVIHADPGQPVTIGDGVTIGHRVIMHSRQVGDGSLIGMGAILLNRARIGARSLVGAGALVTEDKSFEDGKMILGPPARAMRDLTPEQIAGIEKSAAVYVANARRFAAKLQARLTLRFSLPEFRSARPHAAHPGIGLGAEIEPGGLVMDGIHDEQRVELAQLLHQRVADGVERGFAGQHPGLGHEAVGRAEVEDFFFQAGDRARLHVGDDHKGWRSPSGASASRRRSGAAGPVRGWARGRFDAVGRRGLEQRRQLGIFAGGMKLFFAGARHQRMIRQAAFGMEGLHLLQAVGAIDAAADADCPGFRHDKSHKFSRQTYAANGYAIVAHNREQVANPGNNGAFRVKTVTGIYMNSQLPSRRRQAVPWRSNSRPRR